MGEQERMHRTTLRNAAMATALFTILLVDYAGATPISGGSHQLNTNAASPVTWLLLTGAIGALVSRRHNRTS